MLGLVTEPGVAHSTRVADVPEPTNDGVRLRVLEVGVCGTDREISEGRFGVLAEPTSICARAIRHARTIGGRQPWQLQRALVIGAGAIGLLSTLVLRLEGIDVWTASLERSNELVEASGAHYVSTGDTKLS